MKLFTVYLLMGFFWLSYAAMHRDTGYTRSVFSVLQPAPNALLQRQAAAYQSLYGITEDEIAKPINLFGD